MTHDGQTDQNTAEREGHRWTLEESCPSPELSDITVGPCWEISESDTRVTPSRTSVVSNNTSFPLNNQTMWRRLTWLAPSPQLLIYSCEEFEETTFQARCCYLSAVIKWRSLLCFHVINGPGELEQGYAVVGCRHRSLNPYPFAWGSPSPLQHHSSNYRPKFEG